MTPRKFDTLVLSGASVKVLQTLGAMHYAHDAGMLTDVNTFVGTSSGSMVSFLTVIGYTPIELMVIMCVSPFLGKAAQFNIFEMINGGGASSFASIQEELEKITIRKIGYLPTMKDIRDKFYKKLVVVTFNMTHNKAEYITPDTHPDMPCITALRMSASIPLIFEKYRYNDCFYIDGGVANDFAIDVGVQHGKKVLGIVICGTESDFNNATEMSFIEYLFYILSIQNKLVYMDKMERMKSNSDVCIVSIKSGKTKFFEFAIDTPTKMGMFSDGYQIARREFEPASEVSEEAQEVSSHPNNERI